MTRTRLTLCMIHNAVYGGRCSISLTCAAGTAAGHFRAARRGEPWNMEAILGQAYYEVLNCEWRRYKQHVHDVRNLLSTVNAIERHQYHGALPLSTIWLAASLQIGPSFVLLAAQLLVRQAGGVCQQLQDQGRLRQPSQKLTVAYMSSDLGEHPVRRVMDAVWQMHDWHRVKVLVYALTSDISQAEWQGRIPNCEQLRVVGRKSVGEIIELMRRDGVELLIDLNGNMMHNAKHVLTGRSAAVQLSLIGDNKSMGDRCGWDYIGADSHVRVNLWTSAAQLMMSGGTSKQCCALHRKAALASAWLSQRESPAPTRTP